MQTTQTGASSTAAIFPILVALKKFEERGLFIEGAVNPEQEYLLTYLADALAVNCSADELKSFIADNAEELNRILEQSGFDIRLQPFPPDGVGVVTILDLMAAWLQQGYKSNITYNDKTYAGFVLREGAQVFSNGDNEVVKINTVGRLQVYICPADKARQGLDVYKHIISLCQKPLMLQTNCKLKMPVVNLDEKTDISWLENLKFTGGYFVAQALQQNKLCMNEQGIRAQSAVAIELERGISREPLITINEPFYVWLEFDDIKQRRFPLFAAYVAEDGWTEVVG